jgi:hypothetical protein
MSESKTQLAKLAVDFWKLATSFEHHLQNSAEDARMRGQAQLRFSRRRLEAILEESGLTLSCYDGEEFTPSLPVTAINVDDVLGFERYSVESTIEPAIVGSEGVILTGKVTIKGA